MKVDFCYQGYPHIKVILDDGKDVSFSMDGARQLMHALTEFIARAALNTDVAAPLSGVGANAPSLTPTASAPDCLVGEPGVDATTANKPQK
jgi:hypothetical protein